MNKDSQSIELHFDKDALYNKLARNDTFFNELIALAKKDLVHLKSLLIEYNDAKKEAKVRTVAHKLKGTSGSINLPILRESIIALEDTNFSDTIDFNGFITKICNEVDYLLENELKEI